MININLSTAAQQFVNHSLQQANDSGLALRIAVYPDENCYNYGIGFDHKKDNDIVAKSDAITILINDGQTELLDEATLDYVDIGNEMKLIVLNPNDPSFVKPKKTAK